MGNQETNQMRTWRLRMSEQGYTMFRNNVGMGWVGKAKSLPNGDILIHKPRPLHAGLVEGSSDLIGWRSVEITQEMVGCRVAAFVGAEIKSETGREKKAQRIFRERLTAAGGEGMVLVGWPPRDDAISK